MNFHQLLGLSYSFVFALSLGVSGGQAVAADSWLKVSGADCSVWSDEKLTASETVTWSGGCKTGKADGRGILTWTKGGKPAGSYEGMMRAGKLDGPGKLNLIVEGGNNTLIGTFKNGDIDGGGLFQDSEGNIYEGGIRSGKPHGSGYQKIGDEEYVGAFANGIRQGLGLLMSSAGVYIGEFDQDVPSGSGTLEDATGGRYHGQFKDGKPHGHGTYVTESGDAYQGRFVDGKAEGQMMIVANGAKEAVIETWKSGEKVK